MLLTILDKLISLFSVKESIPIGEFHQSLNPNKCEINDSNDDLKFIEEVYVDNIAVEGFYGYTSVTASRKTVQYKKYKITLDTGEFIEAADTHLFVVGGSDIYLRDLKLGDRLCVGNNAYSNVVSIEDCGVYENMYDLEVLSDDHTYYTNNILSHNSTTVAAGFMLHQIVFGEHEKWAILANKGATSREILSRLKMAFEYLPLWIKPGVSEWNKGKISLDNGCTVFAESTASDSIRGQSCVTDDTNITIRNKETSLIENVTIYELKRKIELKMQHLVISGNNQLIFNNSEYEVLTDQDFQTFDGLIENPLAEICQISIDGNTLKCTSDHRIKINGKWIEAKEHKSYTKLNKKAKVYDLLNVSNTSAYTTNNIESHNCTGVLLDEFAHIDNANDFFTSVMPVISSGLDTRLVIVSTPNGKGNLYHKLWMDAVSGANGFVPYTADWTVVPERLIDPKWKENEIAKIGSTRFKQEYECSFSASENTLLNLETLENIHIAKPIRELSQNDLLVYEEPIEDSIYFISVDPARGMGMDYSTFQVIDITTMPFKQVATYRSNKINPLFLPNIIVDTAKKYNDGFILTELNKGADIAKDIYYELEYENLLMVGKDKQTGVQKLGAWKDVKLGLLQSAASKMKGCSNLKSLIESGKLEIQDDETVNELFTFVKNNTSYAADEGKTDDLVMSLVVFSWATTQEYFKELTNNDFVKDLKLNHMQNDILPFGFITDYIDDDYDDDDTFVINNIKVDNNYI